MSAATESQPLFTDEERETLDEFLDEELAALDRESDKSKWDADDAYLADFAAAQAALLRRFIASHASQAARLTALERERDELRALLEPFVDDDECRFDHHGNCQTHYVTNPCIVARARAALTSSRETTDGK